MKTPRFALLLIIALACVPVTTTHAALAPENVVLVVNADSWSSRTIANAYARARQIPASNIIHLPVNDLVDYELINVDTLRDRILKPLIEAVKERELQKQVRCVVYSTDIPYRIELRPDMKGRFPRVITSQGSLNSLTFLYDAVLAKRAGPSGKGVYLTLASNPYFRPARVLRPHPLMPKKILELYGQALKKTKEKKWAEAEEAYKKVIEKKNDIVPALYNLACVQALQKKLDDAMKTLTKAVEHGWDDPKHMAKDSDLKELRKRKDFQELLKKVKPPPIKPTPPICFDQWISGKNRMRPDGMPRYLLSMVLAWTAGSGMSVDECVAHIERCAGADGTSPEGTVYFMANGNVRSRTRQWGFGAAIAKLKEVGVKGEIAEGVLPKDKTSVAGAVLGSAAFNWPGSNSKIVPGAICEHLTSYGGYMQYPQGQTPITRLIEAGAAGSSGTVTEPFAIQAKFPTPFIHWFYASGCTLVESFYQSVAGPYQLLMMGDPLCRLWGKGAKLEISGIEVGKAIEGRTAVSVKATNNIPVKRFVAYIDGRAHEGISAKGDLTLDAAALPPGHHCLSVVALSECRIPVATRVQRGFVVTGTRKVTAKTTQSKLRWGEVLKATLEAQGAKEVFLQCLGKVVTSASGETSELTVDTRGLVVGTVSLVPGARYAEAEKSVVVFGEPISLEIEPPTPLEPDAAAPAWDGMKKGMAILVGDQVRGAARTRGLRVLQDAKIKTGETFRLDTYVKAEVDAVHQFQLLCNVPVKVKINGKKLALPEKPLWRFHPLNLKKGIHRVEATGTMGDNTEFAVRLRYRGAPNLGMRDTCRTHHPLPKPKPKPKKKPVPKKKPEPKKEEKK